MQSFDGFSEVTQGDELDRLSDESGIVPHPKNQLAAVVSATLRRISMLFLVGGLAGTIVWRFDLRPPGSLHGSASGVVVGIMFASVVLAALTTATAFFVDLRFRIDWDAKFLPVPVDNA